MSKTNDNRKKEPYFGSVRFFRHLILTVVALLIIIPVCLSAVMIYKNHRLQSALTEKTDVVNRQLYEIDRLSDNSARSTPADSEKKVPASDLPDESDSSMMVADAEPWQVMVVNDNHTLPYAFEVELAEIGNGQKVDKRIVGDLEAMIADAEQEGIGLTVCSSYRDLEKQQRLFLDSVNELVKNGASYKDAFYSTKMEIALPGKSEHHTGLTVDIIGKGSGSQSDANEGSPEMEWLKRNCFKYGFIQRYPKDKTEITGINYEPYCFRYVGKEVAGYITSGNMTLEEYLNVR